LIVFISEITSKGKIDAPIPQGFKHWPLFLIANVK
jgi:hypothetical protein